MRVGIWFASLVFAFNVGPAHAIPVIDSASGLSAPQSLVDFGDNLFFNDTVISNQFADQGVLFGPTFVYFDNDNETPPLTQGFLSNGNFGSSQPGSILFQSPVTEAAFSFRTDPGTTTFTALVAGVGVETFSAPTDAGFATGRFYGFTGIVFDEIQFSVNAPNFQVRIDNLQFSAVPLPASLPLFLGALTFVALLRSVRRRPKT